MMVLKGDLLDANCKFIAHQVNCKGVMGGGIAKQIKNKFPNVYNEYIKTLECNGADNMFGKSLIVRAYNGRYFKYIVNIFGQYDYGFGLQTNYEKFEEAFIDAIKKIREITKHDTVYIAIPYKIGCGLAGGNWNIVKPILENIESKYSCIITAYKI